MCPTAKGRLRSENDEKQKKGSRAREDYLEQISNLIEEKKDLIDIELVDEQKKITKVKQEKDIEDKLRKLGYIS